MNIESSLRVVPADVQGYGLTRHLALRYGGSAIVVVASGVGRPRLWHYALDAIQRGFEAGLTENSGRLAHALDGARDRVVAAGDALIERDLPDVHLVAGEIDQETLRVIAVGECRAYLHRSGEPKRLTGRDETKGLVSGKPTDSEVVLKADDLLFFGSVSAFSVRSVGRVASVLEADRNTDLSLIAGFLTDPAQDGGLGAGAAVLRVR